MSLSFPSHRFLPSPPHPPLPTPFRYVVPIPIASEARRRSLVLRWLVEVIDARPQHTLVDRMTGEFSDLRTFRSGLYKKVAEVYATAYQNRSFTHFRV